MTYHALMFWITPQYDLYAFGTMLYYILSETQADRDWNERDMSFSETVAALMLPTGAITQKWWNQRYNSAEKVMVDLKMVMEEEGIDVEEMEILDSAVHLRD
ncbi:hypothetical protein L228DRAFT_103707 [Xylona heveae TC161]|uniref:Protein kinase domain-containing protein n=1 Tax=Xylona heveae (strain CBS 132557 / TC161) TaxID=1328760 RepID=A0A165IDY2_XYLHT|nr:hypothetical protein L228DRAFT_103707 [Xylona heveae TC161]KZF24755.1 hypothetical protein L228DRAFT_103707 [Xylona heveae TC161]